MNLINIGFGNYINAQRIVAVISPDSSPVRRMLREATDRQKVVDATCGRKTRAVIITDSDQVILSALQPETVAGRLGEREENE